jgi:hypothetical protein
LPEVLAEALAEVDVPVAPEADPDPDPDAPSVPVVLVALGLKTTVVEPPTLTVKLVTPLATGRTMVCVPVARPAGMVAAAGCDVTAAGCDVTTEGWLVATYDAALPVMMPSELVWVRSAVTGLE